MYRLSTSLHSAINARAALLRPPSPMHRRGGGAGSGPVYSEALPRARAQSASTAASQHIYAQPEARAATASRQSGMSNGGYYSTDADTQAAAGASSSSSGDGYYEVTSQSQPAAAAGQNAVPASQQRGASDEPVRGIARGMATGPGSRRCTSGSGPARRSTAWRPSGWQARLCGLL